MPIQTVLENDSLDEGRIKFNSNINELKQITNNKADIVNGKVPADQIPDAAFGGLDYVAQWNAATNNPALNNSGTGLVAGNFYIVSVAGSTNLSGITSWQVGDWAFWTGSDWTKIPNTDIITSVFGRTGAILSQTGDYNASQITSTPAGNISSSNLQAAINELDSEKLAIVDSRVLSQGENDAAQGTQGTPSNTNRYVTDSDVRNTNARFPTTHSSTHVPGGVDPLPVNQAANVGSLRTLGTTATSACAGNDARLTSYKELVFYNGKSPLVANEETGDYPIIRAGNITRITIRLKTAPTGTKLIVQIRKNGVGWKNVTVPADQKQANEAGFSLPVIDGDYLSVLVRPHTTGVTTLGSRLTVICEQMVT